MRVFSIFFTLFISSALSIPQPKTADITVTISNISSSEGKILVGLYSEDTFMKAEPDKKALGTITNGSSTVVFEDVEPGNYGIIVIHDANGNGAMDFEPSGMPKEAYGVSNNPYSYGPPQWADAKFEVTGEENLALEIRL